MPFHRFAKTGGTSVLYWPDRDLVLDLPASGGELLARCRGFAPLHEHIQALTGRREAEDSQSRAVRQLIERVSEAGGFISKAEFVAQLLSHRDKGSGGRLQTFAVLTRDRPHIAVRCLRSFIENHREFEGEIDYLVADDSTDPSIRRKLRRALRQLCSEFDVTVYYAGPLERRRFVRSLVRQTGLPPEIVKFALFDVEGCGHATGANRNAILLHSAGELVAMADDDIICQSVELPLRYQGIRLAAVPGRTTWFFRDREALAKSTKHEVIDSLAIHNRFLGKSIGECLRGFDHPAINVEDLDGATVQWHGRTNSRVVATATGVAGDSGMGHFMFYLQRQGEERRRLLRSETFYRSAFENRQMLRAANCHTISREADWMAGFSAYDHRGLLPPFMPVLRNQDGVFGLTARVTLGRASFCHLPYALAHEVVSTRRVDRRIVARQMVVNTVSSVMLDAIRSWNGGDRPSASEESTLLLLGNHLTRLGSLQASEFQEMLWRNAWRSVEQYANTLRGLLDRYNGSPSYWARDMMSVIQSYERTIGDPAAGVPADLRGSRSDKEAILLAQRLVRRFGELLCAWPQIVLAARALNRAGIRLGRPLA